MLNNYHTVIIIISVLVLYLITWLLVRSKKIKQQSHRKLWNFLLLINFLVSGVLGIVLAIIIDLNITASWYREMLWIHVEFGIAMGIISVFHFFWHLKYYLKTFSKKGSLKVNDKIENPVFIKKTDKKSLNFRNYFKRLNNKIIISAILAVIVALTLTGFGINKISASVPTQSDTALSTTPETKETVTPGTITVEDSGDLATSQDADAVCLKGRCCSYPGKCSLYIDENNNSLCDLGE